MKRGQRPKTFTQRIGATNLLASGCCALLFACGTGSGASGARGGETTTGGTKGDAGGLPGGGANPGGANPGGGLSPVGGTTTVGGGGARATGGESAGQAGLAATGGSGNGGGAAACVMPTAPPASTQMDVVNGSLIQLNDNGAWGAFTDERAVVDVKGGKLIVGSAASGGARSGNIEAVIYDVATKTAGAPVVLGKLSSDDHAAPAFLVRPDGKYLGFWAGRNVDCNSYVRTYDGTSWAPQQAFDWLQSGCANSATTKITFSNPWYLSTDGKIYDFARAIGGNQHAIVSADNGETWSYSGRLTATSQSGYYKYWGNGVDRIHFIGTEGHPREVDNNLYHGYLSGGKTYDSAGKVIDADITDATSPDITAFTKVYSTGSTFGGVKLNHAWNADIVGYPDGTLAALGLARIDGTGTDSPEHRLLYLRWNGQSWTVTALGKTGPKLYGSEQDYTGGGTLHPDDPHTLYISTTIDPRDGTTDLGKHEIFQGTSCDNGATWAWIPITQNSTRDNLRPTVPKWDATHTALLWFRGTYTSAQAYSAAVVGIVTGD